MFYYLYLKFHGDIHLFNLFRYITFRTAYASLTALVLSLVLGPWVIEQLKKFQVGQFIREEGPGAKVRPDMKVVFFDDWPKPEQRLKGTTFILRTLVAIAEKKKAA